MNHLEIQFMSFNSENIENTSIVIFVVLFCGYYFLSNYGVGKSLGYGFIIAVLYFILAAL